MRVHPMIAALRSDPAAQRRVRAHMERVRADWLVNPDVDAVRRNLSTYASGTDLAECPDLHALLGTPERALSFTDHFLGCFLTALREDALGEVPFRHASSPGFARIQIMQSGSAALSLCLYEPQICGNDGAHAAPSVQFTDCDRREIVLAGAAQACFHSIEKERIISHGMDLHTGSEIHCRPRREARVIVAVRRSLIMLQLMRAPARPAPVVERLVKDGSILKRTSGDKQASQQVMALAVLGALGRADTIGAMVQFARDRSRDPDARWEAVRQSVAMDVRKSTALLALLARNDGDPLADAARALRQRLLVDHPELRHAEMEAASCPA